MSQTGKKLKLKTRHSQDEKSGFSPFDKLASEYDAWFDGEGSPIFFNKAGTVITA